MIATAPFGRTGHDSTRTIFGAAALGSRRRRPSADRDARAAARARRQPHRHRRVVRRLRAAARAVAARASRDRFFLATKTGERDARAGARGDPPLARAARRRPRRPAAAAQPRRRRSSGRPRCARAGRWRRPSRRATRASCASSASPATALTVAAMHRAQPGALRVRLRAAALQLRADAGRALRRRLRGARCDLRRARRRDADDQGHRARAVGRTAADGRAPGTSR